MRTAANYPRDTGLWSGSDAELEDARYEVYLAELDWEQTYTPGARRLAAARLASARERLSLVVTSR